MEKRKAGRPRVEKPKRFDPNIRIWVRVSEQMKEAVMAYADRYQFTTDAEAIRHMIRETLRHEGLLETDRKDGGV